MKDQIDLLRTFLLGNGFEVITYNLDAEFGKDLLKMCSEHICIEVSQDMVVQIIDFSYTGDPNRTYDIDVLRTYVLSEDWLIPSRDINAEINFILEYFERIKDLFTDPNYPNTKIDLENLKMERAKRAFPGWYDKS